MRLPLAKTITSESVNPEVAPAVDMMAGILNIFMRDIVTAINGNLDLDNLRFGIAELEVIVDAAGNVKTSSELNIGVDKLPRGCICINVRNSGNSSLPPDITGTPFVAFNTVAVGKIKVTKVLNLKENRKYILTLLFI